VDYLIEGADFGMPEGPSFENFRRSGNPLPNRSSTVARLPGLRVYVRISTIMISPAGLELVAQKLRFWDI